MEFLFENPFLLIILIGFLSSLFGKKEDKNVQRRRPAPQPKPFVESRPIPEAERKPFADRIPTRPKQVDEPKYEEKREKSAALEKLKELEAARTAVKEKTVPVQAQTVGESENKVNLDIDSVNEDKLVEAIVWAEILGPPKSRKPHRYMNYRS